MSAFETVLMVCATLGSGALIAAVGYLRALRDDARTALRILTGEEELDDDGLVHDVAENREEIRANSRAISENSQRIRDIDNQNS